MDIIIRGIDSLSAGHILVILLYDLKDMLILLLYLTLVFLQQLNNQFGLKILLAKLKCIFTFNFFYLIEKILQIVPSILSREFIIFEFVSELFNIFEIPVGNARIFLLTPHNYMS